MSDQPQVTEVRVHYHGGGKVAIEGFGGESSEYGASVSRTYTIPPGWTEEQIAQFEQEKTLELREEIDPLLQEDRDLRMDARKPETFRR